MDSMISLLEIHEEGETSIRVLIRKEGNLLQGGQSFPNRELR